jgi:hypothetical protein
MLSDGADRTGSCDGVPLDFFDFLVQVVGVLVQQLDHHGARGDRLAVTMLRQQLLD